MTVNDTASHIISFKNGAKPDPYINLVDWANTHFVLTKESSVEPGKYRSSRTPYVEEILMELSPQSSTQEIVVIKPTQFGFALALDTPIPTPSGWTKMGDIKCGDVVFDEKGNPCNVYFVSEVYKKHECRKVLFNDGSEIICDKNHLWTVTDTRNYKILKNKTISTQEIMDTAHDCYSKHKSLRNRYAIEVAEHLKTEEKEFLISPYVLGVWLGDGGHGHARVTQSLDDAPEMCKHIIESGHHAEVRHSGTHKGNTTSIIIDPKEKKRCERGHIYSVVGQTKEGWCKECVKQGRLFKKYKKQRDNIVPKKTFHAKLKELNLFENKHIPKVYLRGSYQQRLELLQGLMDTDGTIGENGFQEFTQVNRDIALSVYELIVSLGIKAVISIREAQKKKRMAHGGYSDMKPQYRITFYAQSDKPVFKLSRKLNRMKDPDEVKRPMEVKRRRIVDVISVPSVPVRCISVDSSSSLYLCGLSMIPTHNTTLSNIFLFAVAHLYPGPCMMAMPTDDMAKGHSKKKVAPTVAAIPALKGIIKAPKSRKSGNTLLLKEFPGGSWKFTGSNSPASARSDSIRYLILDDYDGFVQDMGGEGAPGDLFKKRTDAFGVKRKIYINSTPTLEGTSHIEKEYEESSQGLFMLPCPYCGEYQFLEFGGVDYDYGIKFERKNGNVIDVWYVCKHCKARIDEWQKTEMMSLGKYVHTYPDRKKRGFKINALYSPVGWVSWSQIVDEFLKAKSAADKGRTKQLQVWVNTRMAETFKQVIKTGMDSVEIILKAKCALPPQVVPDEAVALTAFVDVQKHGFWFVVRAWSPNFKSWNIHHGYLTSWHDVEELLFGTQYPVDGHPDRHLRIWRAAVDTGGGEKYSDMSMTEETYFWLRKNTGRGCGLWGTKGSSTPLPGKIRIMKPMDRTPSGKPLPGGLQIIHLNTIALKDAVYYRLNQAIEGGGDMAAYLHKETNEEYARHILAEEKRINKRGVAEWVQVSARNDMFDCECGCLALAEPEWPGGGVNLFRSASEQAIALHQPKRRILSRGVR